MAKILKILIISFVAVLALQASAAALPGSDASTQTQSDEVQAQDLDTSDPVLLPDSPFYFLKEWGRGIKSFFTFGQLKKVELEQQFANERLLELKKLVDEGKANSKILERATEKYNKTLEKIKKRAEEIQGNAEQDENVNKFLEKFTNQQMLHERILQRLEEKVPEETLEKIKQAREQHLERFKEVMTKLEQNKERVAERIQNALENSGQEGLMILERLREKMPDDIKGELNHVRERIRQRINYQNDQDENSCIKEGERYSSLTAENKCCAGLMNVPESQTQSMPPSTLYGCKTAVSDEISNTRNNGIKGKITRGPVCPVIQESSGEDCENKPYSSATVIIKLGDKSKEVGATTSNDSGEFSIDLNPGAYYVEVTGSQALECPSQKTIVKSGEFTEIKILCDTGIR